MSAKQKDQQFLAAIAERLKAARMERQLPQMVVTMDTGINVSRAESGKRTLSIYSLGMLCHYYDMTLEELFRGISITKGPWE